MSGLPANVLRRAAHVADAGKAQPVDLRLGCINATKLWLNGKQIAANHVYHAGQIAVLKKGS